MSMLNIEVPMATNVHLTPELASFACACVKDGLYNNVSEVVRSGLRLLKEQEDRRRAFDAMIARSLKETDDKGARTMDDVEAAMPDSMNDSGSREIVPEATGAETAGTDSLRKEQDNLFWSSLSLTELAKAQGVAPVDDLDDVSAMWPSDDSPDEVLTHVLTERAARRTVANGNRNP